MSLKFEDLTFKIIGAYMNVHNELGHGFNEGVYQEALQIEFQHQNISYIREKEFDIQYRGKTLNKKYIADFVCFDKVIVELKASQSLIDEHIGQVINYLKASNLEVGLLVNFGSSKLTHKRIVL
jgi:GxxExxY protein